MKLRSLSDSAKVVIAAICKIDANQPDTTLRELILEQIGVYDKQLRHELKETGKADKEWRTKRSELSMFYEMVCFPPSAVDDHAKIIDQFIKLDAKEFIQDGRFIFTALTNGLLRLTEAEINNLLLSNAAKEATKEEARDIKSPA